MEDKLLILRFKRGSTDALCRIYEKYEAAMLTVAAGLLNDLGAAEDVVHDVFVALVETPQRLRLAGSLRSYLATCVANRARDRLRTQTRQRRCSKTVENAEEDEATPLGAMVRDEQWRCLAEALAQLPYEQREVIMLRLHGDLTFHAIAGSTGVSINTVQSRYRYGIDKLRLLLNGEVPR
ncbi:MAG: sigma-70 family RNA polymerase sigma factor [Sedimentisphaerales bacterium]|nr:sigma-70 family RNA polymerase sigma factor [Sedimentisphaerales bacterium]